MRSFARRGLTCALLIVTLSTASPLSPASELEQGFADPPASARTRCFWWWLNGNVTKQAITRDLEQLKAKGFGGALIFDANGAEQEGNHPVPAGPMFGTPEWRELFAHAVREASRLELELSVSIQSGWNLGGPDVTPEEAAKQLTWSRTTIQGPGDVESLLPLPSTRDGYYRDIAVLACRFDGTTARPIRELSQKAMFQELGSSAPDGRGLLVDVEEVPGEAVVRLHEIKNLTGRMDPSGRLRWTAPEGRWEVIRFGTTVTAARVSTASGRWQGRVIDYMSTPVLKDYWGRHVQPLLDEIGPLAGTTLKYLQTDSWECGGMNWTPGFEQEFQRRRGYDPIPYLPVIGGRIIESRDVSNRFLADFRKTLGDCVAENHYQVFADLAHARNLGIHPESGGPHAGPFDALKCLGRSDIPMGEFWAPSRHRPAPVDRFFVKQAASAAHIYGKRQVAAEGFTSIGPHWNDSLGSGLKPSFDHEACAGLNLTFIHTVTCSPPEMGLPGQEYFAGTHFNPNVTWWDQAGAFVAYLNRCHFLLQQGRFVADACYYYGDHVPNLAQLKEADPAGVLPGYDYDVVNEEVLLRRMTVKNGRLTLPHGMAYRVLVLPDHRILSLAALRTLHQLVRDGATVIGPRPLGTASLVGYPASETELDQRARDLWGDTADQQGEHRFGKGRVVWGRTGRQVLADDGILPDFACPGGTNLDYLHRTLADGEVYFVANLEPRAIAASCTFRTSGRQPELWDPIHGTMRRLESFQQAGRRTTIPLEFDPHGSLFVVFRAPIDPDARGPADRNFPQVIASDPIAGPWSVHFDPRWGGPAAVAFERLVDWAEHPDPAIRFYSGTARYETTFDLPQDRDATGARRILDLGDVRELAQVRLNGKDLGVVWTSSFRVDVTEAVRPRGNRLEVTVVNTWRNRLAGDRDRPPAERLTHTNINVTPAWQPIASGLLGPVRLQSAR
jgi:hypothetical protein